MLHEHSSFSHEHFSFVRADSLFFNEIYFSVC